jgi:N-acetylglucosaminyldiphosphoundecaprenol N-acetyl-beta-D-mannosaminyltransferase
MNHRIQILNGPFDPIDLDETIELLIEFVKSGNRGWVCTVNVAILMMMRDDPFLQKFVDRACFVVADGQPLVWAAQLFGERLPSRVTGIDLVTELSKRAAEEKMGIYFLGAKKDVVDNVAGRLSSRIPDLEICGVEDGYFTQAEATERAKEVARSGAKILFVGMGAPRQEHFIEAHWDNLGVQIAIGVGGSFDVVAGLRTRAPEIVQRLGLEWLFRLAQEPTRLAKRYILTNSQFIYHLTRELFTSRLRSNKC